MTCMKIYTHGCHISYIQAKFDLCIYEQSIVSIRDIARSFWKWLSHSGVCARCLGACSPKFLIRCTSCFWGPLKMLVKFFIRSYKYIMYVVLIQSWLTAQQRSKSRLGKWNFTVDEAFIVCALICAYILKRLIIVVSHVILFWDRIFL